MPYHRFRIGERVIASAFGAPQGTYEITRVLPVEDGIPFYRAKSVADGHERALAEPSLRRTPGMANGNRTPLRRPRRAFSVSMRLTAATTEVCHAARITSEWAP